MDFIYPPRALIAKVHTKPSNHTTSWPIIINSTTAQRSTHFYHNTFRLFESMSLQSTSNNVAGPPIRSRHMVRENLFYVEAIIGQRMGDDGSQEYLVKWEGFDESESTWEPDENIPGHFITAWDVERDQLEAMGVDDSEDETQIEAERNEVGGLTGQPAVVPESEDYAENGGEDEDGREVGIQNLLAVVESTQRDDIVGDDCLAIEQLETLTDTAPDATGDNDDLKERDDRQEADQREGVQLEAMAGKFGESRSNRTGIAEKTSNTEDEINVQENPSAKGDQVGGATEINDNDSTKDAPGEDVDMEDVGQLWPGHTITSVPNRPTDRLTDQTAASTRPDAGERCNDPAATRLGVVQHSPGATKCTHPRHVGGSTETCTAYFSAARSSLTMLSESRTNMEPSSRWA